MNLPSSPFDLSVRADKDRFLLSGNGVPLFEFTAKTFVRNLDCSGPEEQEFLEFRRISEREFEWRQRSNFWKEVRCVLNVTASRAVWKTRVSGKGRIGTINYFPDSEYEAGRYFFTAPTGGKREFPPYRGITEECVLGCGFQTPPLFAFPFEIRGAGWLSVGLAPYPGEYLFEEFRYRTRELPGVISSLRCFFQTDFMGYKTVDGEYDLPDIVFHFRSGEYSALAAYARTMVGEYGCPAAEERTIPRWHRGPFFCGWGEQYNQDCLDPKSGSNQEAYERMTEILEQHGIRPEAVMIDDKWMADYGSLLPDRAKWHDLRRFTDVLHAKGIRTVLWLPCWEVEGLNADECGILKSARVCSDPTSPAYRARIRDVFRTLLSSEEGCFNCDGFKVDFAPLRVRAGGVKTHGGIYGIELLKELFRLFYETAKSIKPDALINASAAHPYFRDVVDQCRLHDYDGNERSAWEQMNYRANLFRSGMPEKTIDTDCVLSSRRETLEYIRNASRIGVPDLYYATGYGHVKFDDEIYAAIRESWAEYRNTPEVFRHVE